MTLFPYKEGKSLVWDFTCIDTLASSYIKETSNRPGAAAEKAEKLKLSKYEEISKDYLMVPIAVETFGAWGPEGVHLIKSIGQKIQNLTGEKRSTFFLFQSISMAVQRGNAASILGTVKSGKSLDQIFYLCKQSYIFSIFTCSLFTVLLHSLSLIHIQFRCTLVIYVINHTDCLN